MNIDSMINECKLWLLLPLECQAKFACCLLSHVTFVHDDDDDDVILHEFEWSVNREIFSNSDTSEKAEIFFLAPI